MKVFYRWLYTKIRNAGREVENKIERDSTVQAVGRTIDSNGMNFTVYRANGGHIIEHRSYDKKLDRNNTGLHIITDDKDLGEELGKIITFENLRS